MGLIVKEEDGMDRERKLLPEDIHHAICIGVIELGTIHNEWYDKDVRQVLVTWEIPDELITFTKNDEELTMPMITSKTYTVSLHEKSNLRKDLENWRGRKFTHDELQGFDLKNLLAQNCMLQIMHQVSEKNGKTYANIASIIPLIKGLEVRTPKHAPVFFSWDTMENDELPDVPDWIINRMKESFEWQNRNGVPEQPKKKQVTDDDLPF